MRPCRFSPHFTHGPAAFGPAVLHTALPLSGPFVLLPVRALPSCPAGRHFSQKEMADKAPGQSRLSFGVGGVSVRAASANNERSKKRKAAPTADQRAKGENSQGNKRGTKAAGSNVKGVKKITVPQEASGKCVRAAFPAPTVGPTFVLRALAAFSVSMLATLRVASACAFALGWQRRARVPTDGRQTLPAVSRHVVCVGVGNLARCTRRCLQIHRSAPTGHGVPSPMCRCRGMRKQ